MSPTTDESIPRSEAADLRTSAGPRAPDDLFLSPRTVVARDGRSLEFPSDF
jgi:hypothetical protein